METREFYYEYGVRVYIVTFEEHIANIFRILNSSEHKVDTISFRLFEEYSRFIKNEIDKKGIKMYTDVGFWGYNEIFNHGIFGPYKTDEKLDYYDGFAMIKPLTQDEYMQIYMNHHPAECAEILTSDKLSDYIKIRNRFDRKPQNIIVEVRNLRDTH